MPTIPLTKGMRARVSWQDYRRVAKHKWSSSWSREKNGKLYAVRTVQENNTQSKVFLHRFIMGVTAHSEKVDHINHDSLDNRRSNLRVVSNRVNTAHTINSKKSLLPTCVYNNPSNKGRATPYIVQIYYEKKLRRIGLFHTVEKALAARNKFLESIDDPYPDGL